ncbi:hypothetical protein SAMN04488694_13520 [Natrinema hispanicum]|uniref:Uncharacterized protein n=2 Tax=Natrinema hispanicum TaxID=392421 RepID=A0A1I0J9K1_9EURY|nr:hypothetical protein SAMN04488694_13520 [Natrinema hispanicum]
MANTFINTDIFNGFIWNSRSYEVKVLVVVNDRSTVIVCSGCCMRLGIISSVYENRLLSCSRDGCRSYKTSE